MHGAEPGMSVYVHFIPRRHQAFLSFRITITNASSGDCIDFIQKLHGLSFKDALKYLGIEQGRITPEMQRSIKQRKRRAELVKQFKDWEQRYCIYISDLWFQTKQLMIDGIPPEDIDLYASLFHMLPVWEYHRDILINGSDELKFELYKEAQNGRKF